MLSHFQQHLIETGTSICTRNRTMTGVKFLFRVTLRRHDLVAEIFSPKEPVKVPLVLSRNEVKRVPLMAPSLKARVMLSLARANHAATSEADIQATSKPGFTLHRRMTAQSPLLRDAARRVNVRFGRTWLPLVPSTLTTDSRTSSERRFCSFLIMVT